MSLADWTVRGQAIAHLLGAHNRADLKTFFGPRADVYLATYDKMVFKQDRFVLTWSWPSFLLAFTWFFYRRMYTWGAVFIFAPIVLGILFPSKSALSMAGIGALAKTIYVRSALSRIDKADSLGLAGAEREDYLRRAGGVSLTAGILAGLLYSFFIGAVFYVITFKIKGTH